MAMSPANHLSDTVALDNAMCAIAVQVSSLRDLRDRAAIADRDLARTLNRAVEELDTGVLWLREAAALAQEHASG
jgi:hypothetical protein